MDADLATNVVLGALQVVIGILALLQRGGVFPRRDRVILGRRRSKYIALIFCRRLEAKYHIGRINRGDA